MATYLYGYNEDIDSFCLTTIKKWEKKLLVSSAKKYLRNHLLRSLKDDFPVALCSFKKKKVGHFALLRIIFPYITFLGSLYKGEDGTEHALEFMFDYMGRVSKEYEYLSGVYYFSYRHGLLHTNIPKIFSFGKRKLGWHVTYADTVSDNRGDCLEGKLLLYPKLFYDDLCKAVEFYISDFDNLRKQKYLFANFKKGFIDMSKINSIKDVRAGEFSRKLLRKGLKRYSI